MIWDKKHRQTSLSVPAPLWQSPTVKLRLKPPFRAFFWSSPATQCQAAHLCQRPVA